MKKDNDVLGWLDLFRSKLNGVGLKYICVKDFSRNGDDNQEKEKRVLNKIIKEEIKCVNNSRICTFCDDPVYSLSFSLYYVRESRIVSSVFTSV